MSVPPTLSVQLPPELVEQIAQRVAELLRPAGEQQTNPGSPWLTFEQARSYLGFSRDSMYKLTAARAIPTHKKLHGQGLRFHQAELDAWMEARYPRVDRLP